MASRERQLARRQHRRLLAQKRAELRREPGSRQIILTHRDERAARMLVQRREHMAPRRLAARPETAAACFASTA